MRKNRRFFLIMLVAVILAGLSLASTPAQAAEGFVLRDANVGRYHLTVFASPNPISVGKIKFFIRLGQRSGVDQEYPIRNAAITVQFKQLTGAGSEEHPKKLIVNNVLDAPESEPGTYEVADSLDAEGTFRAIITIKGSLGSEVYNLDFEAKAQPDDRLFSVLLVFMIAVVFFAFVLAYLHSNRNAPKDDDKDAKPVADREKARV